MSESDSIYCRLTKLRLVSPQYFDHCDDKYHYQQEYKPHQTTVDLLQLPNKWIMIHAITNLYIPRDAKCPNLCHFHTRKPLGHTCWSK